MTLQKQRRIITIFLVLVLCVAMFGCQSEEDKLASEAAAEESRLAAEEAAAEESRQKAEEERRAAEEAARAETENRIIDILESAPAVEGWSLSMASAIVNTFHQYEWDYEYYGDSDNIYLVTFTGNYSPNPRDLPQLSQTGSISFLINVESGTVSVHSDPNRISSAFVLLALPY